MHLFFNTSLWLKKTHTISILKHLSPTFTAQLLCLSLLLCLFNLWCQKIPKKIRRNKNIFEPFFLVHKVYSMHMQERWVGQSVLLGSDPHVGDHRPISEYLLPINAPSIHLPFSSNINQLFVCFFVLFDKRFFFFLYIKYYNLIIIQ